MCLNVIGAQFVVLFLGWLIEKVSNLSLPLLTIVLFLVGLLLFLLPMVPGPPIYITIGIVTPAVAQESFGGMILVSTYCAVICLLLKLTSCAIQQKCIGEKLA